MPTETDKLKIKLIQPTDMFADDAFNNVIKDLDNKVVGIAHLTSGAHWEVWTKNTDYAKGDIVRTPYLKSNQYLECINAGKTGTDCPNDNIPGTIITDNTAKWIIRVLGAVDESTISIWIGGEEYRRGSLVLYNNKLYRCKVPHTATTFDADSSKWQEVFASLQEWKATFYYALNDTVLYDGKLFKCILANDDTVFDANKWSLINNLSIVYPYEQNTNYMEGQLVTVNGKLYRCTLAHTSTTDLTTDINNWEEISGINEWTAGNPYIKGNIALYGNRIYICNKSHTSTTDFDSDKLTYWSRLDDNPIINDWTSGERYEAGSVVIVTNINGISKWKENTSYKVGDSIVYSGYVYTCSTANNDATFTESNWTIKEPVYNRIYRCIKENKDTTFTEANWQLINGDSVAKESDVEDLLL